MLEAGLVGSRLVHLTCAIILFGSAFFCLYSPLADGRSEFLARRLPAVLLAAALCSLLSGLAWFLFTVGNMSGTLAVAFDTGALWCCPIRALDVCGLPASCRCFSSLR